MKFALALATILLLLSSQALAVQVKIKSTVFSDNLIEKLNKHALGKIILQISALAQTRGQFEALFQALKDLEDDIQGKLSTENNLFQDAQSLHQTTVNTFTQQIDSATMDVDTTTVQLNNVLYPNQVRLQDQIQEAQATIDAAQQSMSTDQAQREQEAANNQQAIQDLSDGISAIDEALALLITLRDENTQTNQFLFLQSNKQSFVQIQKSLNEKLSKINGKFEYKPIINALTQLLMKKSFADQQILQQILDLLNNLRSSFIDLKQSKVQYEYQAQIDFQERMDNYQKDIDFQNQVLVSSQNQLQQTNDEISADEAFLAQRKSDLDGLNQSLSDENNQWAVKQGIHDDLVAELNNELSIIEQARQALKNAGIYENA